MRHYTIKTFGNNGICLALLLFLAQCATKPFQPSTYRALNEWEQKMADTLLLSALDHEALYTLIDTLKPMSSVKFLRFPIAADSLTPKGKIPTIKKVAILDTLESWQRICQALSTPKVSFVIQPFRAADKGMRHLEIYAIRHAVLAKLIIRHRHFFGQYGFTASAHPTTVLATIENEHAYNRWRGYGYLFGYPDHAVDFFVEAGKSQDSTGQFVERQFFHMPVWVGRQGFFTYALPKTPDAIGQIDSAIYRAAVTTLEQYKARRKKWVTTHKLQSKKIRKKINQAL
jgi:hypothetical protein